MAVSFDIISSKTDSIPAKEEMITIKNTKATLPSSSAAFFFMSGTVRVNTTNQLNTINSKAKTTHEITSFNKKSFSRGSSMKITTARTRQTQNRTNGCIFRKIFSVFFIETVMVLVYFKNPALFKFTSIGNEVRKFISHWIAVYFLPAKVLNCFIIIKIMKINITLTIKTLPSIKS